MYTVVIIKTTHKKSGGDIHYTVTCKTNNDKCKVFLVDNDLSSIQQITPVLDVAMVEDVKEMAEGMEKLR